MRIVRALVVFAGLAAAGCNSCPTSTLPHCPGGPCGGGAECVDGQWTCTQLQCGPDLAAPVPADLMSHASGD